MSQNVWAVIDAGYTSHHCVVINDADSFEIGFRLIQDFYGDDVARESILQAEYAPEPLFATGSPELAGPALTAQAKAHTAPLFEGLTAILKGVGARLNVPA